MCPEYLNPNTYFQSAGIDVANYLESLLVWETSGGSIKHSLTGPNEISTSLVSWDLIGGSMGSELTVGICVALTMVGSPSFFDSCSKETTKPVQVS